MKRLAIALLLTLATSTGLLLGSWNTAWADTIEAGWDLWETPAGGTSTVTTPFGVVVLKGKPIGPGDTDTIIRRTNPMPSPIPPGDLGTFDIEVVALSLRSVNPVNLGPTFADLYVTINKLGLPGLPQPDILPPSLGKVTITGHNDGLGISGGGSFDSFFDVWADLIFTIPGGDPSIAADRIFTQTFTDRFTQTGGTWSHTPRWDDPHNAQYPAGHFYPGVDPVTLGKVLTPEQALLAQHGIRPGQIPEPETYALMLAGLALLGIATRRRRNSAGA